MEYINEQLREKFGDGATGPPHRHGQLMVEQKKRKKIYRRKWPYFVGVVLLLILAQPISDWYVQVSASPAEKALADRIGLTGSGRVLFFHADPEVGDSSVISQVCAGDSGALEEGCYLPSTNKIYIRSMPDELQSEVVVTAAHEFLHAVYFSLDDNTRERVNSMVETEYQGLKSDELRQRIGEYNKREPGAQDIELHSILGSEFPNLDNDLEIYYSQYFTNRSTETDNASEAFNLFSSYATQLKDLDKKIDSEKSVADNYYNSHVRAANSGDEYYRNYFYNLYTKQIDQMNADIDQYNSILTNYQYLVSQYLGESFSSKSTSH